MLTVEPYQFLTVFILFYYTILPEKVYSILIFPPRASLDISFFETYHYHEKRNYFPGFPPHGRMNKMLKTVFWDWNGTTVADVPLVVRINNEVFARHGIRQTNAEEYRRLFRFPVQDYYRDMGVSNEMFYAIADEWSRGYHENFPGTPLTPHAAETARRLHDAGLRQVILSASQERLLKEQLAQYPELAGCFDEVMGLSDIYAISKVQMGVDYMKRSGLSPEEAVFLGDTLHDAETAHAMGCACLLISGGHQPDATLRTAGVPVLPSLREAGDWILERHTL